MKHELTCIVCPRGCRIQVWEEEGVHRCEGNQCIRGEVYAIQEVTEPRRMFTSTVQLNGSQLKRCPVVSSSVIKKTDVFKVVDILENVVLEAPVFLNQVVIKNILESRIDIIASRSIKKDAEASD